MRGFLLLLVFLLTSDLFAAPPVNYDIVYVRQPRYGDNTNTTWPEVFHPANLEPAADLILLHWNALAGNLVGTNTRKAIALSPFDGCTTCTIEANIQFQNPGGKASLLGWYQDRSNLVEVVFIEGKDKIQLIQKVNGKKVLKTSALATIDPDTNYRIRITYGGGSFAVFLNGSQILTGATSNPPSGTVGFKVIGTTANFAEILVY